MTLYYVPFHRCSRRSGNIHRAYSQELFRVQVDRQHPTLMNSQLKIWWLRNNCTDWWHWVTIYGDIQWANKDLYPECQFGPVTLMHVLTDWYSRLSDISTSGYMLDSHSHQSHFSSFQNQSEISAIFKWTTEIIWKLSSVYSQQDMLPLYSVDSLGQLRTHDQCNLKCIHIWDNSHCIRACHWGPLFHRDRNLEQFQRILIHIYMYPHSSRLFRCRFGLHTRHNVSADIHLVLGVDMDSHRPRHCGRHTLDKCHSDSKMYHQVQG